MLKTLSSGNTPVSIITLALAILVLFLVDCDRDLDIEPAVVTGPIDSIAAKKILIQAEIIDVGSGISDYGHCYGTSSKPEVGGDRTNYGEASALKEYTSEISGLELGSEYFLRAYVTSEGKHYYGKEVSVFTRDGKAEVLTEEVEEIRAKSAKCGAEVISAGGDEVVDRGFCWSKNISFDLQTCEGSNSEGSGLGGYKCHLSNLDPETNYFTRSYAITNIDTAYGEVKQFSTLDGVVVFDNVSVSDISNSSCQLYYSISGDGGDSVTATGFCWGEQINPTLSGSFSIAGEGTGSFSDELEGLTDNTLYYVRPFAINSIDTYFGQHVSVQTNSKLAIVTTPVFEIGMSTAVSGGSISGTEGSTIIEKGICWSQGLIPSIENSKFIDPSDELVFTSPMMELTGSSSYFVRAYVITDEQTVYGDAKIFTTDDGKIEITTIQPSQLTANSAQCGGLINDDGGSFISERGICWATSHAPTIADYRTSNGTGSGSYESVLVELGCGENYRIRAYAINEAGIKYGNELQYNTEKCLEPPTVAYLDTAGCTRTGINAWSNVTDDGGAEVVAKGFCWSTSPNPDLDDYYSGEGSGTGSFSNSLEGLSCGTTYYLRAYATNSVGTAYSPEINFRTHKCYSPPTVSTLPVSQISDYSAMSGGAIVSDGGALITAKGICWSTSPNPTIQNYYSYEGSGNTTYASQLTGLSSYTIYYFRAYATNSEGTAYGDERTFKTSTLLDYDGNVYETVVIGDQTWMKENLRTTHYADGTAIPNRTDSWDGMGPQDKAYCWYNNNISNGSNYGALYNWAAAMNGSSSSNTNPSGVQGVCPDGWHLPSDREYDQLSGYISDDNGGYDTFSFGYGMTTPVYFWFYVGTHLKSTIGWGNGWNGTDDYGFTGTPGGCRKPNKFTNMGLNAYWWTTGAENIENVRYCKSRYLGEYEHFYEGFSSPYDGYSIRCVKD